jgi:hypothetical protein
MKLKLKSTDRKFSKSERLIYIIIFLWIVYGILGILHDASLTQLAAYYASLTLFISTYLWGEHKRTSNSSYVLSNGRSSSREIIIYVTVLLWCVLGAFGIIKTYDINTLTVYFTSLTPFVSSYIIYKTTKGNDLPIFNGKSQEMVDNAVNSADMKTTTKPKVNLEEETEPIETVEQPEEDIENEEDF